MLARLIPLCLASLMMGNALAAQTLTVDSFRGPATVPATPETIAVFDVAAVDTLNALGVPIAGTVANLYVDYLDAVSADATALGSFWEPDLEGTYALKPDLIIVGSRSSDQLETMAKIAPSVDMTVAYDLVNDALARLRDYGRIFAREDKAAELETMVTDKIAAARAASEGKGDALIIMANGPKISAYGSKGRFAVLHKDIGLPEAAPEIGESIHGEAISFEFIRDTDPDWLIVVDRLAAIGRPGEGAKATLDNALVQQTKAWQSDQVIYLNAADVYIAGGGIQSLIRTLDDLIAGFSG